MRKLSKFLLASFMLAVTIITFISSTYAFVILNKDVDVDEFNMNLKTDSGILISLDGENFSQNISLAKLKAQIEKNLNAKYEELNYEGVTLSQTNGKINYNGLPLFVKDQKLEDTNPDDEIRYTHSYTDADLGDYLFFDLTFRLVTQGDVTNKHSLKFSDITKITGNPKETILHHSFTAGKKYNAGDKVMIDPANAMRIGVLNEQLKIFEVVNEYDLGSTAIEGGAGVHDKNNNLMYQYYNALFDFEPFTKAAEDGEGFNTIDSYQNESLGEFVYDNSTSKYNDIKLSIIIWLEGWDADYTIGVPVEASMLKINLGFEVIPQ